MRRLLVSIFFCQAEDGIRDLVRSRGLGDVYKRQVGNVVDPLEMMEVHGADIIRLWTMLSDYSEDIRLSLIHI